jgi:hypothetical protein
LRWRLAARVVQFLLCLITIIFIRRIPVPAAGSAADDDDA